MSRMLRALQQIEAKRPRADSPPEPPVSTADESSGADVEAAAVEEPAVARSGAASGDAGLGDAVRDVLDPRTRRLTR